MNWDLLFDIFKRVAPLAAATSTLIILHRCLRQSLQVSRLAHLAPQNLSQIPLQHQFMMRLEGDLIISAWGEAREGRFSFRQSGMSVSLTKLQNYVLDFSNAKLENHSKWTQLGSLLSPFKLLQRAENHSFVQRLSKPNLHLIKLNQRVLKCITIQPGSKMVFASLLFLVIGIVATGLGYLILRELSRGFMQMQRGKVGFSESLRCECGEGVKRRGFECRHVVKCGRCFQGLQECPLCGQKEGSYVLYV